MYIKICKTGQYHIKEWEETYFQNSACIEQIWIFYFLSYVYLSLYNYGL